MKKLLLLCACLWALASEAQAQTTPVDIVIVRVRDRQSSATVFITRGEGKTEKLEVVSKGLSFDKGMAAVGEGYYKVIAQLYREGYVLHNSSATSAQVGDGITTYFFSKDH